MTEKDATLALRDRLDAIAAVADAWRDSEHPPRAEAVEATLDAPNRFTEEALAYALNQQMELFSVEAMTDWLEANAVDASSDSSVEVGVLNTGAVPADGLRDLVAVWGAGHRYVGTVPDASPAVLPAFAEAVQDRHSELAASFVREDVLYDRADALIAQPPADAVDAIHAQCDAHDIPREARHLRPPVASVAVIDGNESEEEREDLAEDMLLHEGLGRRRVAVVWAPRDRPPDAYLEAMAQFRGVFPVHPDTPGALQMQQALLDAQDASHAYGEGLEFLVSRGAPEVQTAAHVRWSEYDTLDDVAAWLAESANTLYAVVARDALHEGLAEALPETVHRRFRLLTPGHVHRPPLDDADGRATARFLSQLR